MVFPDFGQRSDQGKPGHVGGAVVAVLLLFALVQVPMPLEDGLLDDGLLVVGDDVGVDHVVEGELGDVVEVGGRHIEADGAVEKHRPELEERVQGERGHVGLGPAVAALLDILLELDPSEESVEMSDRDAEDEK